MYVSDGTRQYEVRFERWKHFLSLYRLTNMARVGGVDFTPTTDELAVGAHSVRLQHL
jgi:hypothetical protein